MQQSHALVEIHEDRIQNLESAVNDTNASLAEQSTKLDFISKTVETVKHDVHTSMDKGLSEIKHEVQKTSGQIEKLHVVVQDHGRRLDNMERNELERSKAWSMVFKTATFLAAGIAGASLKYLVDSWLK